MKLSLLNKKQRLWLDKFKEGKESFSVTGGKIGKQVYLELSWAERILPPNIAGCDPGMCFAQCKLKTFLNLSGKPLLDRTTFEYRVFYPHCLVSWKDDGHLVNGQTELPLGIIDPITLPMPNLKFKLKQ